MAFAAAIHTIGHSTRTLAELLELCVMCAEAVPYGDDVVYRIKSVPESQLELPL